MSEEFKDAAQRIFDEWNLGDPSPHGFLQFQEVTRSPQWAEEEQRRERVADSFPLFTNRVTSKMKENFRKGVPHTYRRRLYLVASGGFDYLIKNGNIYESILATSSQKSFSESEIFFGSSPSHFNYFSDSEMETLRQLLHCFAFINQEAIQYSPLITTTTAFFLLYMEPPLVFASVQSMIIRSKSNQWFFGLTASVVEAFSETLSDIAQMKISDIKNLMDQLGVSFNDLFFDFLPNFFQPCLSLQSSMTLFDSFVIEGRKILTRIPIGLLKLFRTSLLSCKSSLEFKETALSHLKDSSQVLQLHNLIDTSFKIFLSRSRNLDPIETKHAFGISSKRTYSETLNAHEFSVKRQAKQIVHNLNLNINQIPSGGYTMIPTPYTSKIPRINIPKTPNIHHVTQQFDRNSPDFDVYLQMLKLNDQNFHNKHFAYIPKTETKPKSVDTIIKPNNKHSSLPVTSPGSFDSQNISTPSSIPKPEIRENNNELVIVENMGTKGTLLTDSIWAELRKNLPINIAHHKATVKYALTIHGTSLPTIYSLMDHKNPAILVCSTRDFVFGAFLSDPPFPRSGYFGNAQCFLFKVFNGKLNIWKSTKANSYYISASEDDLIIGGPNPALFLNRRLEYILSDSCETFASPRLTTNDADLILDLEMYQLTHH